MAFDFVHRDAAFLRHNTPDDFVRAHLARYQQDSSACVQRSNGHMQQERRLADRRPCADNDQLATRNQQGLIELRKPCLCDGFNRSAREPCIKAAKRVCAADNVSVVCLSAKFVQARHSAVKQF